VYYRDGYQVTRPITIGQDEFVAIEWITPVNIASGNLTVATVGSAANGMGFTGADPGFGMRVTEALIEPGWKGKTYFDGGTPDTEVAQYDWEATAFLSPSTKRSWY
jgi:hypothetical protein